MQKKFDQNLIIRLPNWVGDAVMSLPAIMALNDNKIDCTLIGKAWAKDLLSGTNLKIVTIPSNKFKQIKILKAIDSKHILLMTNSLSSAIVAKCARKKSIGMKTDGRTLLLRHAIHKKAGLHEVEYYWQLAQEASQIANNAINQKLPDRVTLPLSDEAKKRADIIIEQQKLTRGFILVCPMAAGLYHGQSKVWPHWSRLIDEIQQQGRPVVTCPAPNELERCQSQFPKCTIIKDTSLSTLAAICAKARVVLSNDTGPMHISTAVNPRTCGILGVTNPTLTRPWGGNYLVNNERGWPSVEEVLVWINEKMTTDR